MARFSGKPILHFQVLKGKVYLWRAKKEDSKKYFPNIVPHLALQDALLEQWVNNRMGEGECGRREGGKKGRREEEKSDTGNLQAEAVCCLKSDV